MRKINNKKEFEKTIFCCTFLFFLIVFNSNIVLGNNNSDMNANIILSIPESYQTVMPGQELLTSIKLLNLAGVGRIDVVLDFEILNHEEEIIYTKKETVAIETQANFVRSFKIPQNAKEGKYFVRAKMIFADGKQSVGESSFFVKKENSNSSIYLLASILIILLLILSFLKQIKKFLVKIKIKLKINKIIKKRIKN